jgi:hypothetical protein
MEGVDREVVEVGRASGLRRNGGRIHRALIPAYNRVFVNLVKNEVHGRDQMDNFLVDKEETPP